MKYILITHCAGCLWCVVRRGHARPSKWHTVTSSSWQTNFDYWCVRTSRRGVRHSPDFHETAVHKVLANLICPSRYFQKQPVSPSAKQWERPQDNKISPGRAWWGGPEEGARGGCTYDDPANARYRRSKPSLLVIIHLTSLRGFERVNSVTAALKRSWYISPVTVECGEHASMDRLGLLVCCLFVFVANRQKKKRIGQMISWTSASACRANSSTHSSVAFQRKMPKAATTKA